MRIKITTTTRSSQRIAQKEPLDNPTVVEVAVFRRVVVVGVVVVVVVIVVVVLTGMVFIPAVSGVHKNGG